MVMPSEQWLFSIARIRVVRVVITWNKYSFREAEIHAQDVFTFNIRLLSLTIRRVRVGG